MASDWKKVEEVFESALERPPEERAAFLDQACESDPSLRSQVETLLLSLDHAQTSLPAPEFGVALSDTIVGETRPTVIGKRLGSYRIEHETADGVPKLLDFGIAKLLNPDISSAALDPTTAAVRLMTPEYASPEQVRGDRISTAASFVTTKLDKVTATGNVMDVAVSPDSKYIAYVMDEAGRQGLWVRH